MASIVKLLLQQSLSHEHVETPQRIYKTRRSSSSLYEEVGKLKNCMDSPRSMESVENTDWLTIRRSDLCQKFEIAVDEQAQICGMIGEYLNKQIQVNDTCQVSTMPGHCDDH